MTGDAVAGGWAGHETVLRQERFAGAIFRVFTDTVTMPGGGTARRDVTEHRGAVAVVALDDAGQVLLIRQYRHAVRRRLWELPAGLLDVAGEDPVAAAARELAEETDWRAARWDLLADLHPSPGFSDETIRLFLARDLAPVPEADRHTRTDEEAGLRVAWFGLDEAVAMALRGEVTNAAAVAGLLAAARARDGGWAALRPADAPPP